MVNIQKTNYLEYREDPSKNITYGSSTFNNTLLSHYKYLKPGQLSVQENGGHM